MVLEERARKIVRF